MKQARDLKNRAAHPNTNSEDTALEWIRDYLKDRKQFAVVNGCKLQLNAVKCGIPQGSLLGPRLFSF